MVISTFSRQFQKEIIKPSEDPSYRTFDAAGNLIPEDDLLSYKLGNDLRKYEEIENDAFLGSHCDKRRRAANEYDLKTYTGGSRPDDLLLAEIVRKAVPENIDYISECLNQAVFVGHSGVEFFPEVKTLDLEVDGQKFTRECLVPANLAVRDPARFIFSAADNPKKTLHCMGYEARQTTKNDWIKGEPLPLNKFIIHHYGSLVGNPYGKGIYRRLYWLSEFKKEVLRLGLINSDGRPTPFLTYERSATDEEINQAKEMLKGFYQRSWMMLPDVFKVNFATAFVQGQVDSLKDFLAWFDAQAATCIVGATLTSSTDTQATRGSSQVHYKVTESQAKADASMLSEAFRLYFIEPIALWNAPKAARPTLYRDFTPPIDREKEARIDTQLFAMGFKPTLQRLNETYGGEGQYESIESVDEDEIDDEVDIDEDDLEGVDEDRLDDENEDFSEGTWKLYFFAGRRTGIIAKSAAGARKKLRRGGTKLIKVRALTESERKTAAAGYWVRSGPDPEKDKPGYKASSKRGYGPKPKGYSNHSEPEPETMNFSISVGSTVSWKYAGGTGRGKVIKLYRKSITLRLGDSEITRNGTDENPAVLIEQESGAKVLKLASELSQAADHAEPIDIDFNGIDDLILDEAEFDRISDVSEDDVLATIEEAIEEFS